MRSLFLRRAALLGAYVAVLVAPLAVAAQTPPPFYPPPPLAVAPPPPSPESAEIAACLCLKQSVDELGASTAASRRSDDEMRGELGRLDAQLARERASMDVNNPQSVARFRQMLDQRDAVFRRSSGPVAADLGGSVERYNAASNEYNARCANRPRNPVLLGQVQASLTCPPR